MENEIKELKIRIEELEKIAVMLYKKTWKLEHKNSSRSASDSSWLNDLKKEAAKTKI